MNSPHTVTSDIHATQRLAPDTCRACHGTGRTGNTTKHTLVAIGGAGESYGDNQPGGSRERGGGMIVKYITVLGEPEIYMQPENASDHRALARLERECVTKGCGRHATTGKLLHVRIALERFEKAREV